MLAQRNAEIDRRNAEIDREIQFFRTRVNREFQDWRHNTLTRFNISTITGSAFIDGNRFTSSFQLMPIYGRGAVLDGFTATGRINENTRVVFDERRSWFPDRAFQNRQPREQRGFREPLEPRIPRRTYVRNTMQFNPNISY